MDSPTRLVLREFLRKEKNRGERPKKQFIALKKNIMNLKNIHLEEKAVQTNILFSTTEGKVISMQIAKGEQLKEHITKVQALLVCVIGNAIFSDENGLEINLKSGDFVKIEENVKHKVDAIVESNFLLIK